MHYDHLVSPDCFFFFFLPFKVKLESSLSTLHPEAAQGGPPAFTFTFYVEATKVGKMCSDDICNAGNGDAVPSRENQLGASAFSLAKWGSDIITNMLPTLGSIYKGTGRTL